MGAMTTARALIVNPGCPGTFHCVSRCVRRAFLCGEDALSGRSFEHRKQWIEDRLLELADIFAVGLYAYAVMSNHLHVVLRIEPEISARWSDEDVAQRWCRLYPARIHGDIDPDATARKQATLLVDPQRLGVLRERLADLSWLMRAVSEPIARQANREDGCTGRFWEGRFKCQALLDEGAILSCMAYVDLNPIRAGLCKAPESSSHTAIKRRIEHLDQRSIDEALTPIAGVGGTQILPLATRDYLALVDWTGRMVREDKRGAIPSELPDILRRLGLDEAAWQHQTMGTERLYYRAIGRIDSLMAKAEAMGQRWLKGLRQTRPTVAMHSPR